MNNIIDAGYQSPLTPQARAANSGGDSSNSLSLTSLGSTFLNLLTQELKNQDPTAPMDATAMVGQMISLNQLDQLISINQTLGGLTTQPHIATKSVSPAVARVTPQAQALPFDPTTLMPASPSAFGTPSKNSATTLK